MVQFVIAGYFDPIRIVLLWFLVYVPVEGFAILHAYSFKEVFSLVVSCSAHILFYWEIKVLCAVNGFSCMARRSRDGFKLYVVVLLRFER